MSIRLPISDETDLYKIVLSIRELAAGRSNAVGSVTLTSSTTETVVTAINCGPTSEVFLMPKTVNASGAFVSGTLYITDIVAGSFTINHSDAETTDRTFSYVCIG